MIEKGYQLRQTPIPEYWLPSGHRWGQFLIPHSESDLQNKSSKYQFSGNCGFSDFFFEKSFLEKLRQI